MEKDRLNPGCNVLIIGGSAGSLEIILDLLPELRPGFTFTIVIVIHRGNASDSMLSELLSLKSKVPIREVEDKDPIKPSTIYLAPADYHLLFEKNNLFSLDASEKVNHSRPSIDVTFESAADVFGKRTVAILLSGANSDGTRGLMTIKNAGGRALVQDPNTAAVPFMPLHAMENVMVDKVLRVEEMVEYIFSLQQK